MKIQAFIVAAVATLLAAPTALAASRKGRSPGCLTFKARASGAQEVPPVMSKTSATVELKFDKALSEVWYDVDVFKGVKITQAHLHCAPAGLNGDVAAFLFNVAPVGGPGGMDVNGNLSSGKLTNDDIIPIFCADFTGFAINNIASLFAAIQQGIIYLNVHSEANPPGEVRGQIFPFKY